MRTKFIMWSIMTLLGAIATGPVGAESPTVPELLGTASEVTAPDGTAPADDSDPGKLSAVVADDGHAGPSREQLLTERVARIIRSVNETADHLNRLGNAPPEWVWDFLRPFRRSQSAFLGLGEGSSQSLVRLIEANNDFGFQSGNHWFRVTGDLDTILTHLVNNRGRTMPSGLEAIRLTVTPQLRASTQSGYGVHYVRPDQVNMNQFWQRVRTSGGAVATGGR